ncbi:hypothetical protein WKI72_02800 [Candidatus Erwinia dacicola]
MSRPGQSNCHLIIAELEHILNTRGRKSLGYRSPNEVFLTHLLAA